MVLSRGVDHRAREVSTTKFTACPANRLLRKGYTNEGYRHSVCVTVSQTRFTSLVYEGGGGGAF